MLPDDHRKYCREINETVEMTAATRFLSAYSTKDRKYVEFSLLVTCTVVLCVERVKNQPC